MLRTHWTPSPCTRLSRARTTTGPPPHFASIDRQQVFPAVVPGTGEVVPTFTLEPFNGCSAMPLQLRHGYAAVFHRGLPVSDIYRPRSSPTGPSQSGSRCNPAQICQVRAGGPVLRGFLALVPRVHLSVSLAGPVPYDSAGTSRRCQGCFRLRRCSPVQAALSFMRPAATGRRWWYFTTTRFKSASWRSISQDQVWFGAVATSSGLAYWGCSR